MKKTFRGLMADGDQQRIRLSTNTGLMGYKIHTFRGIPENVGTVTCEGIFQIFTTERSSVPTSGATVDFTDPTLLGVCVARTTTDVGTYGSDDFVVFDDIKFNQDIFITYTDNQDSNPSNYYIELEQVKLSKDEATVATLKDMRGRE